MSKNDDALEVAQAVQCFDGCECPKNEAAAHIRRLVAENEALQKQLQETALQCITDFDQAREAHERTEAQAALLRQALEALEWAGHRGALVAAIRQHLETNK